MAIILKAETEEWLKQRMELQGFETADDAVRALLEETEDDRSPETLAAIQEGLAQARAGRGRSWEEFKKGWMARHTQD